MYQCTLTHPVEGSVTLTTAMIGWENLQYAIRRHSLYHGVFVEFAAQLQFIEEGKEFIDLIDEKYGFGATCDIAIKAFNQPTFTYVDFISGTLNFATLVKKDVENGTFVSEIDILAGQFEQKIMNRADVKVDYQYLKGFDGGTIIPNITEQETVSITLNLAGTGYTVSAVYIHELFERIIYSITGEYKRFSSALMGKAINEYGVDGRLAYKMIIPAMWLRGYEITEATVSQSLNELFTSVSNIWNLGLSIELVNGLKKVIIDDKSYFYQPDLVLTIGGEDDTVGLEITDLEFSYDSTLLYNSVVAGYDKSDNEDNSLGNAEYNNQSKYSIPVVPVSNELSLISGLRADGTGMKMLIDDAKGMGEDTSQNKMDNDIFIVSCQNVAGVISSIELEGFTVYPTIYGTAPHIYCNLDITPARIIDNNSDTISIGLQKNRDKSIIYQSTGQLSKPSTRMTGEVFNRADCEDIPVTHLKDPYLSGIIARFNAPLGLTQILQVNVNKHGKIKFWDYMASTPKYRTGWIREISTNPIDKNPTNYEIMLANDPDVLEDFYYLLAEDGTALLSENGNLILQENVSQ